MPEDCLIEEGILVTTRDGTELFFDLSGEPTAFSWLSSTELVPGREDSFYHADINTGALTRLFALSDKPFSLQISPDNRQLAFHIANRLWDQ